MKKLPYIFRSLCFITLLFIAESCEPKEEVVKVLKEYTVTFNSNGGTAIDPIKVKENTRLTKPSVDPVKEAYAFLEWQLGGEKYDFNTLVTGNIMLTAVWEVVEWKTVDIIGSGGVKLTRYLGKATAIVLPESVGGKEVLEIGAYIFGQSIYSTNANITGVDMSKATKLRTIGGYAFINCTGLTSVTIPNSVTTIGFQAFRSCASLISVTLPIGLTIIRDRAFEYCEALTSITIPSIRTYVGNYAFANCTGLTSITIPSGLTNIGDYAFANCTGLTSITIPSSVTAIKWGAFFGCSRLTLVTLERSANPLTTITSSTFQDTPLTSTTTAATIKHPSRTAYNTANGWKDLQATFEAK